MTPYNSINVKLSDLQLNKLKSATKNRTGESLRLSSNTGGATCKAFVNNPSANIKPSKTQIANVLHPLAKSVLIPLGLADA